jgi:hypothetical protein
MVSKSSLSTVVFVAAVVIGLLVGATPAAHAVLKVDWYSIDAGGGTATGGTWVLHGTPGQPDAHEVSAGTYVLTGGFRAVSHCVVCDINEDGYVDVADLLDLVYAFGTARGDPGYNSGADFNVDGYVDVVDLLWLVDYFGHVGT